MAYSALGAIHLAIIEVECEGKKVEQVQISPDLREHLLAEYPEAVCINRANQKEEVFGYPLVLAKDIGETFKIKVKL